jgi:uncharacterized protein
MEKVPCPICKSLSDWKGNPYRPFCSEHCRGLDLGNWATEKYRVEAQEDELSEKASTIKKEEE